MSAQHLSVLNSSFEKHPSVVPVLRAASDCQRYAWPSPHTPQGVLTTDQYMKLLLKEISNLRMVGRLMFCGARFLASKDQVDESAMLCVDLMRLTGLQETGPTVVVYQTNVAIRQSAVDQLNVILQESVLEPKTHTAIERVLAEHESSDAFVQALKTERAFGISSFQNMPSSVRWFSGSLPDYLGAMQAQIELGKTPPHKILASAATSQFPLTQLSMQAVESCRNAFETDRIRLRCLRILNALRSKQIVACELPSECLGLAAEAIEDPYSGRSLNMDAVETANGIRWCIHSDGPNPFAVGEMARGLPNDKGNGRNPNAQNPYAQGENQRHQMDLSLSP
ncbi:hypothetical protein LOC71_06160 [Rhodopirellula sp. JC740]|uniref:Uncharacterized protein n=1 Tax=Rhodopirellula halodulae TaxID=2894198 RepID=A0ABS8NE68_9BACT|nr:hypothetical protein [Rhodopirellula sp. JC740]MCC9641852.1 hypothetical protein [Rhodopirellula sp. JC740]